MIHREMLRRNFLWTTLCTITGSTIGAGMGATAVNVTRQANDKQPSGAENHHQKALHKDLSKESEQQAPEARSTVTTKDKANHTAVTAEEAKVVRDATASGAVIGAMGGCLVDEAFHSAAVASENDSNTFS